MHGVLWRLTPRDLAAINAYENLDSGLYLRRWMRVRLGATSKVALVYVMRRCPAGTARPGYIALVVGAAHEWNLPDRYIKSLQRWSPSAWRGARAKDIGDVG